MKIRGCLSPRANLHPSSEVHSNSSICSSQIKKIFTQLSSFFSFSKREAISQNLDKNFSAKDYRKILEDRFGKELVEKYLDKYFSSYPKAIASNNELIFKTLARLIRRDIHLEKSLAKRKGQVDVEKHQKALNFCSNTLEKIDQSSYNFQEKHSVMIQIYHLLGTIDPISSKTIAPVDKKKLQAQSCILHQIRLKEHKLYSLPPNEKPIDPSLWRRIYFVFTALVRLFQKVILRKNNWNEIQIDSLSNASRGKLIVGALPNHLTQDLNDLEKEGVTAVLSLTEPFENENCGLSRPYSSAEWEFNGIVHGKIEAKDHHVLNDEQLHKAADFIHEHLQKGSLYVHCRGGVGRSNMAIAAYLIKYCGCSPQEAAAQIKKSRPQSTIDKKLKRLEGFYNELLKSEEFVLTRARKLLKDRLLDQTQMLKRGCDEFLCVAKLANETTDRNTIQTKLIGKTDIDYKIEIQIGKLKYSALVNVENPRNIQIKSFAREADWRPKKEDVSNWNEIHQQPCFLSDLRAAAQNYIKEELRKERSVYGFDKTEISMTPPTEENFDLLWNQTQELTQKDSTAQWLLQQMITQTGFSTSSCCLMKGEANDVLQFLLFNTARPLKIAKVGNNITIEKQLDVRIYIQPSLEEVGSLMDFDLVDVIHTINMENPQDPTLTTTVKRVERI